MDTIEEAAAKGREIRESGWPLRGLWVSQEVHSAKIPKECNILLLKMDRITREQMQNLYNQIRKERQWIVLFDFGQCYESLYMPKVTAQLTQFLRYKPPMMVWEAGSERRARRVRVPASRRRSCT